MESEKLLLKDAFLTTCSSVSKLFPGGQDYVEEVFSRKYFNVIDPFRVTNNLGRSVTKGIYT